MAGKSTMIELVAELEKVTPRTAQVEELIAEAKAGEYHDYKNRKYACGKVEAYRKLQAAGLYQLANQIRDGEYDETADEDDKAMMKKQMLEGGFTDVQGDFRVMSDDKWGVGSKANDKAWDTTIIGGERVDLVWGEHPHSRQDNNVYARFPDGRIEGFDGHRVCTRIEIEEHNYLKTSGLAGNEVRKGGSVKVFFDGKQCFEDFVRTWEMGLSKARKFIDWAFEGPVQVWKDEEWEKLVGRKVYYRETPAVVTGTVRSQNCMILEREDGSPFPKPCYADDGEWDEYENRRIKVELDSPHIWWWRK